MSTWKHKKSAREKLNKPQETKLVDIEGMPNMAKKYGTGKLLVPTPLQVDALIREIPEGHVASISDLRDELGRRNDAVTTCPLCAGIFWRISADAAEENRSEGIRDITPYWRLIKDKGGLNEKLPGGEDAHAMRLKAEGHNVQQNKRGKWVVEPAKSTTWR